MEKTHHTQWRIAMNTKLQRVEIIGARADLDLRSAKRDADARAETLLTDPICLAWVDTHTGAESPAHASECHGDCEIPGAVEYAINRGAELEIVVGDGRFVFCYRSLGEFADC
jgi:hypothetical protein